MLRATFVITVLACLGTALIWKGGFQKTTAPEKTPQESAPLAFSLPYHHQQVRVQWAEGLSEGRCYHGQRFPVRVQVTNESKWYLASGLEPNSSRPRVNVSYRWLAGDALTVVHEGGRSFFQPPLKAGETRTVEMVVQCPSIEGPATLMVDLVQEGVSWLHQLSPDRQARHNFRVQPINWRVDGRRFFTDLKEPTGSLAEFAESYGLAVETLISNLMTIHLGDRNYNGFVAGSIYPMIWARDAANVQRGAALLGMRGDVFENHWTDLFLMRQSEGGELPDWVAPGQRQGMSTGKNTIQSDQELWVILGALEAVQLGLQSRSWLDKSLGVRATRGESLIAAMGWLLRHRWSKEDGCLWTGHIADWGDVGLIGRDNERSTRMGERSTRVCGIFSQSLLWQGLTALDQWNRALLDREVKDALGFDLKYLREKIKTFSARKLWSQTGGYFRIHHHLDEQVHSFDETGMFPLGGNVVAMESGLATEVQKRRICQTILSRQRKYNMQTVGGVLLPPYPQGTYENEIMDQPYEYQNGGQWDWFGPRVVVQMASFDRQTAQTKLREISQLAVRNGGFFEWYTIDGKPEGSKRYTASAAAFLQGIAALARGLKSHH